MTLPRLILAFALVPVGLLVLLWAAGAAAAGPALLSAAVAAGGALVLALLCRRELRILGRRLHGIGGAAAAGPHPALLGPIVSGELTRLAEVMAQRTALVDRLLLAEKSIVERLPDPLVLLGRERAVLRANAAARAAFGADLPAVLRHPLLVAAIDRAIVLGAAPQTADLRVPVPVSREVQAVVVPLEAPLAEGGLVLVVLSDRSRERAVERMRADFVANASHELRTPLASLIGFIDTLRGPAADDPPAQARFLGIMAEQAERMNRLIDDLLSLSRIEITEHLPPADRVDLRVVVDRALAGLQIGIAKRGVTLALAAGPALPAVLGDADQLQQVAQNLLDNALKYGPQGGTVHVGLAAEPLGGGRWPARPGVVLSVADEGAGIPRQHLPRLTERFYRVDTGRSRAVGGTGLGLAIVKHIVNRHRGALLIESEAGQGARFSIWLPMA